MIGDMLRSSASRYSTLVLPPAVHAGRHAVPAPLRSHPALHSQVWRRHATGGENSPPQGDPPGEFPVQHQESPGSEAKMDPKPDYGYDTYTGTGKLKGKTTLVTGSDSGIGRAIAFAFAKEGANVAIAYLSETEDAKETQRVCEAAGVKTMLCPGDLSEYQNCKSLVKSVNDEWGPIDVLVNNASFQGPAEKSFVDIDRERLEYTYKSNILAYFSITSEAVKTMPDRGAVINICSIQAVMPMPGILDYASTKGAIITFTKGASADLAGRKIRVNSIAPGPVWTPLIVQSFPDEVIESFGSNMAPLGRAGMPAEYGPAAVFLADNGQSSFITGACLPITGGMLM